MFVFERAFHRVNADFPGFISEEHGDVDHIVFVTVISIRFLPMVAMHVTPNGLDRSMLKRIRFNSSGFMISNNGEPM